MKILYGVVGEGMGHATRSRVVLDHLARCGHDVEIVASGPAHRFLSTWAEQHASIRVTEIHGLGLSYADNRLRVVRSLAENVRSAPAGLWRNAVARWRARSWRPDVVISDFESWAWLFGMEMGIPVISIDNMQIINRCTHDGVVTDGGSSAFRLAKASVKVKLPGAYHYLVSSFFFPEVRKARTTLVAPILRDEILAAERRRGEHVTTYVRALPPAEQVELLRGLPFEARVYGCGVDTPQRIDNVVLMPFSQSGFIDDLRRARAVIAGGGFSLMTEAVHLGVPMLSIPIEGQYEQELNARYLERLGYGRWTRRLSRQELASFVADAGLYERILATYPRQDNAGLFAALDELLMRVARGSPSVESLSHPTHDPARAA